MEVGEMLRSNRVCILGAILLLIAIGCSNSNSPTAPLLGTERKMSSTSDHFTLGLWQFTADPMAETLKVAPLREADFHLNALTFLEPPPPLNIILTNLEFQGNTIDVDVGLRHPLAGYPQFTGFDVCGMLITNGSVTGFGDGELRMAGPGDTRLINHDGYSRWWNPAEFPVNLGTMFSYNDGLLGTPDASADYNCTLNGYKYYADELGPTDPLSNLNIAGRGVFSTGKVNTRHYTIRLGNDGLIFNYAVDACWKMPTGGVPYTVPDDFPKAANRPEAYRISVVETLNTLTTGSGELELEIWVYDWFNPELNTVTMEAPGEIKPVTVATPDLTGEGYAVYTIHAPGCTPLEHGDLDILVSVTCEQTGYGGLLPGAPVAAYFMYTTQVAALGWARTWGGYDSDYGTAAATDSLGAIYIAGNFQEAVDFDPGIGTDIHFSNGESDFFLCKYDTNGDFSWARTWGGDGTEFSNECNEVVADENGNVYIAGNYRETVDFDPGPGTDEHTSNGYTDAFLCKFDGNGDYQWTRTWGGNEENDSGSGIATDASGNIYITGKFRGEVDFDPGDGTDVHTATGNSDAYLSKFNPEGVLQWAVSWGGDHTEGGNGVATVSDGVCVTGHFDQSVDFDPGDGIDIHTPVGNQDVFVSKFDAYGGFEWARCWGGINNDIGYGIAIDNSGNIYITGEFSESVDFDPGPGIDEHKALGWQGKADIFLCKFSPTGDYQWAQTWGGYSRDRGGTVRSDTSNSIYVSGCFDNTVDFDPGPGIDEHESLDGTNIFISKFGEDGNFIWARTWCSNVGDQGHNIGVDTSGNIYSSGSFMGTVDFDPGPGTDEHSSNGHRDASLSKFPPGGNW